MVILGLGSNVGDRLANLRLALHFIKKIPGTIVKQVSPIYLSDALLPDNAPAEWDMPHLNLAMRCETTLEPLTLLDELKKIELTVGRKPERRHWGPRIIDIDILAWDERIIENERLSIPHRSLEERPFALWPLADVAPLWKFPLSGFQQEKTAAEIVEKWGSRYSGKAPLRTRQIYQRIDTPQLVGIINATPDSFSDGGKFIQAENALEQALYLVNSGAEVLDLGAESTAPQAKPIDHHEEWKRLEPVLSAIKQARADFLITPKLSVDTRHPETAKKALAYGVDILNDVTGLQDPAMRELVAATKVDCIVMHHLSIPASREHVLARDQDVVPVVYTWAEKHLDALEQAGIAREKIILDPGIGFGKVPEHSLALIKNAHTFKKLGTRVLIGHSRKSFLTLQTPYPFSDRDVETVTLSLYLAKQGIDYLRVHHVEMNARAIRMQCALDET